VAQNPNPLRYQWYYR